MQVGAEKAYFADALTVYRCLQGLGAHSIKDCLFGNSQAHLKLLGKPIHLEDVNKPAWCLAKCLAVKGAISCQLLNAAFMTEG